MSNGRIDFYEEFGIVAKMKAENSTYGENFRKLASCTSNFVGTHFFAMQKATSPTNQAEAETYARLVTIASSTNISSRKSNLKHANDCTYYNGEYFVVTNENTYIYSYNATTLTKTAEYKYEGSYFANNDLHDIAGIAYLENGRFMLSKGLYVTICEINESKKQFIELKGAGFKLESPGISNPTHQGIYVSTSGQLFKPYSIVNNGSVKKNYIAKWDLTEDNTLVYKDSTFRKLYTHQEKDEYIFEIEGISAVVNEGMYAGVRIVDDTGDKFKAKLYKITLVD